MRSRSRTRASGFTLIELLVVLALLGVVAIITIPPMLNFVARSKVLGSATQASTLFRLARAAAVKRGATVVIKALPAETSEGVAGELFAFTDVNNDLNWDKPTGSDLATDQDGNKLAGSFTLPKGVTFAGPGADDTSRAASAYSGLETQTVGSYKNGIVRFLPTGAVQAIGALRLRDERGNILEIRIDQLTTGRVTIRKFDGDPNGSDNVTKYYVQGGNPTTKSWSWL